MERQQFPNSLHCTILPHHVTLVDKLLNDLRESAENVRVLNKKPAFVHHIKSYVFRGKKPRGEQRQFTAWWAKFPIRPSSTLSSSNSYLTSIHVKRRDVRYCMLVYSPSSCDVLVP